MRDPTHGNAAVGEPDYLSGHGGGGRLCNWHTLGPESVREKFCLASDGQFATGGRTRAAEEQQDVWALGCQVARIALFWEDVDADWLSCALG